MTTKTILLAITAALVTLALAGCGDDDTTPTANSGPGSGPSATVVGSVDLPDDGSGVYTNGTHAFIATSGSGLQVVDVTDRTAPAIVGGLATIFAAGGVTATMGGDFLYVCANAGGFHVIDIGDPLMPFNFSTVNTPGTATDVALTSIALPVLCVADGASGVQFYFGSSGNSSVDTPELATGVAATDIYCFVTDLPDGAAPSAPAMHVINLGNPSSPNLVRTLPLAGSPSGITISGNFAYVAAGEPGMYVIDISDPANPFVAGQTGALPATGPIVADPARNVVYLGTTDTAGFTTDGLKIIRVSNPSSPSVVATVNLPDWTTGLTVFGDHVYAVTDDIGGSAPSTLQIIDVSDF